MQELRRVHLELVQHVADGSLEILEGESRLCTHRDIRLSDEWVIVDRPMGRIDRR